MLVAKRGDSLYIIALILFILSGLYGLSMRWNFAFPLASFEYENILQGHSHVAFLGWGFLATLGAITTTFISKSSKQHPIYKYTINLSLVTITLMLISFLIGGYEAFSITLLSIFIMTSYVLLFRLLKDLEGKNISTKLVRYGIYYYLLSSLAIWFLPFVLISQGKTALYYNTIYFYLHFLYNGFFVFTLFGLLFRIFEQQNIEIAKRLNYNFVLYLNIACVPAYALSILWSDVSSIYNVIGFAAGMLQFISLFFLIGIIRIAFPILKLSKLLKLVFIFFMAAYSFKILLQILSAFPYFVQKSLAWKPFFIIGYLHLFTLAFMSVFLFFILHRFKKIELKTMMAKFGITMFLFGVLCTEGLMFTQGFFFLIKFRGIPNYNLWMLVFSVALMIGLIIILGDKLLKKDKIYA